MTSTPVVSSSYLLYQAYFPTDNLLSCIRPDQYKPTFQSQPIFIMVFGYGGSILYPPYTPSCHSVVRNRNFRSTVSSRQTSTECTCVCLLRERRAPNGQQTTAALLSATPFRGPTETFRYADEKILELISEVKVHNVVFWVRTMCSPVGGSQRLGRNWCLHFWTEMFNINSEVGDNRFLRKHDNHPRHYT
jgi:hypothetical protein